MTREAGHSSAADLSRLAALEPDRARTQRTRQHCHALLARRRAARTRSAAPGMTIEGIAATPSSLPPVVIGAFCLLGAAYVGGLLVTAIRLLGQ
jgi:hypothetical protein